MTINSANSALTKKSIMYKIISLGYSVYIDDDDEFLVNILVCDECKALWNNSRTECFYCGTENYHVYKCTKCGKLYSITNPSKKCLTDGCKGKLTKQCINPSCPSNTIKKLHSFLDKKGGVFEKKKSGSCYNEMRCKHCGNSKSKYISKQIVIVDNFDNRVYESDRIYIRKNSESDFDVIINSERMNLNSIESILNVAFEIDI